MPVPVPVPAPFSISPASTAPSMRCRCRCLSHPGGLLARHSWVEGAAVPSVRARLVFWQAQEIIDQTRTSDFGLNLAGLKVRRPRATPSAAHRVLLAASGARGRFLSFLLALISVRLCFCSAAGGLGAPLAWSSPRIRPCTRCCAPVSAVGSTRSESAYALRRPLLTRSSRRAARAWPISPPHAASSMRVSAHERPPASHGLKPSWMI